MNFRPLASSSKGNCYLVESSGVAPLLIECGISIKEIRAKLNFGLSDLAGCLVSHEHQDHAKAVDDLLRAGIDCYMSKGTADVMGWDGHHRCEMFQWTGGYYEAFRIQDWIIKPFPLEHDAEEPTGFLILAPDGERLLFIPDTSHVQNRFSGVNILAVECNHLEDTLSANILNKTVPEVVGRRIRRNHMSLERLIKMLAANDLSRCRQVFLLHLSAQNSDESKMIKAVQQTLGVPVYAA